MGSPGFVAWSSNQNTVPTFCVYTVLDSGVGARGTKSSWTCSSSGLTVTPHYAALWICLLIINPGALPSGGRCLTCPWLRTSVLGRSSHQSSPRTCPRPFHGQFWREMVAENYILLLISLQNSWNRMSVSSHVMALWYIKSLGWKVPYTPQNSKHICL